MIISVLNTKGGVGKSTVAINLAVAFALDGYDTLLIDTDEEGTSLAWVSRREQEMKNLTVVGHPNAAALKKNIGQLVAKHDLVVIDGAPHLQEKMNTAVWISNLVLIPVKPSPNDIWKLGSMIERIRDVQQMKEEGGGRPPAACFVVNDHVARTRLSVEVEDALAVHGFPVLRARLATRMDYRDSFSQGCGAIEFTNRKARQEVASLVFEVKQILGLGDVVDDAAERGES